MPFKEEDVGQINTIRTGYIRELMDDGTLTNFSRITLEDATFIWNCVERYYIHFLLVEQITTKEDYPIILNKYKIQEKAANYIKKYWNEKWTESKSDVLKIDKCREIIISVIGPEEYNKAMLADHESNKIVETKLDEVDGGRKKKKTKKIVSKKRRARASRKRKTNKKKM
jgi:hypothetical protein